MTVYRGPSLLLEQYQQQPYINMGVDTSGTSGNGYTDEDLLASLAGFAVEGQTERDLATIKSMLAGSTNGFSNMQHRAASAAAANGVAWPMQSNGAFQQQQHWQYQNFNNPPPNTPTFSKSMELHAGMLQHPDLTCYNGGSSRRRDVSLDRSYTGPMPSSSQGGALGMDMEMSIEEDENDGTSFGGEQGTSSFNASTSDRHNMPSSSMDGMYESQEETGIPGGSEEQTSAFHQASNAIGTIPYGTVGQSGPLPAHISPPTSFSDNQQSPAPSRSATPKQRQKSPPAVVHSIQTRSRTRNQANNCDGRSSLNGFA